MNPTDSSARRQKHEIEILRPLQFFDALECFQPPQPGYVMELLLPPPGEKTTARLLLGVEGKAWPGSDINMITAGTIDLERGRMYAWSMGRFYAHLHHVLNLDGRDLEFHLGVHSSLQDGSVQPRLVCIDFGQVRRFNERALSLMAAAMRNRLPYIPAAGSPLWTIFREGYLAETPPARQEIAVELLAKVHPQASQAATKYTPPQSR
ncbi:hypothetical protein SELMODRAFT_410892 [Selaginella moellendorffii]|uniref:Uncharacterized protein n=1 Tax=Selaginella moellendorffii TaxID=88036 RepID=D8RG75_SELML|nr:hypothetical protein SELMODRAFT_410892 [Selaginella moellendorffii]